MLVCSPSARSITAFDVVRLKIGGALFALAFVHRRRASARTVQRWPLGLGFLMVVSALGLRHCSVLIARLLEYAFARHAPIGNNEAWRLSNVAIAPGNAR